MCSYDRIRPLSYPDTDIFVLAYSVVGPDSFHNISHKWYKELKLHNPHTPFILVGTKKDLRNDEEFLQILESREMKPVTFEQGAKLAKDLGAREYIECSSTTREGIHEVFIGAIKAVYDQRREEEKAIPEKKRKNCSIL